MNTQNNIFQNKYKVRLEKTFLEHFNCIDELKSCGMDFIGDIYLIKNIDDTTVGALDFKMLNTNDIYIEMIEILSDYQNQGYTKEIIRMIKDLYPNSRVFAQSIPNERTKDIWISIGASFDSCSDADCDYDSFDKCRHHCSQPADYFFTI